MTSFMTLIRVSYASRYFGNVSVRIIIIKAGFNKMRSRLIRSRFSDGAIRHLTLCSFKANINRRSFPLILGIFMGSVNCSHVRCNVARGLRPFVIRPSTIATFCKEEFVRRNLFVGISIVKVGARCLMWEEVELLIRILRRPCSFM